MGLFESTVAGIMSDSNPLIDAYTNKKAREEQRAEQRQTTLLNRANDATSNMLARPDLVDSRSAALASQFNTTLAKPKFTEFANKTDAIDAAAGDDSPMAGVAGKIKRALSANLSNSMNSGKSMAQIEYEATQSVITPELVNSAHEHQFKKDSSFSNAFGIFGNSKSGTKPLPGYEDWRANRRLESEKSALQFGLTSNKDSGEAAADVLKEGAIGGVSMAAFAAALGAGAAVIGTAPVSVPAIAVSALVTGLAAIPATIAARQVQSAAENSDWQAANPDSKLPHIAGGLVGAVGGGGLARVGFNAVRNAGMRKLSTEAAEAFIASGKNTAVNAAVNVGTGAGAVAGGALGAAEPGMALDLLTFIGAEQAVMKGGKAGLAKLIEKSMLSEQATKLVMASPTGANMIAAHKAMLSKTAADDLAASITKENTLATVRKAEAYTAQKDGFAAERESTRLAKPQFDEAGTATYLAGEGLASDVTNRTASVTVGKGKKAVTKITDLGNNEDDLIIRGLREKGLIEDSEALSSKVTTELSDVGFTKTLSPETATLKVGTIDEKLAVELDVESIAKRNAVAAAEHRLVNVHGDLLSAVGNKGDAFNPARQMEALKNKNNAYGDVGTVDTGLLNSDLELVGSKTLGKHTQNILNAQSGKFASVKAKTYEQERNAWKTKYGITAAGLAGVGVLGTADDSEASMITSAIRAGGKVFSSVAEHAVMAEKFPSSVTVQGESLWNAFKKFGTTKAEFTDLGLDKIKPGTKVTKQELSKIVEEKGLKIGEDVYGKPVGRLRLTEDGRGVENVLTKEVTKIPEHIEAEQFITEMRDATKPPQFSGYKAIKSEEGVVPGSYREEFVTASGNSTGLTENQRKHYFELIAKDVNTADEKAAVLSYEKSMDEATGGWQDPHSNYDSTRNPIGRFRYDVQVQPDGKKVMRIQEVQQGFKDTDPNVPQSLRDRWQEITVKKAIARAKAEGVDGISWATGEQQRSLYDNALRNVADEARYNPVTKEFTVLKNGRTVDGYPKVVEPDGIAEHIGKDPAKRLLESKINAAGTTAWNDPEYTKAREASKAWLNKYNKAGSSGDTELQKTLEPFLEKAKAYEDSIANAPGTATHTISDLRMDAQWPGKLYGDFAEGNFNNKATIPSLLHKHGKGELGVLGGEGNITNAYKDITKKIEELDNATSNMRRRGVTIPQAALDERNALHDSLRTASQEDVFVPAVGSKATAAKQPVMWLNEKTPSSFTLYTHPATVAGTAATALAILPGESPQSHVERSSGDSIGKQVLDSVLGTLANSMLADILGGSEAHAGTAATVAKAGLTIPKVLEEYFTSAFGKGSKALQAVVDGGFVGKPLGKNALTMRGTLPTGDFSTVPDRSLLKQVFANPTGLPGSGAMTPMGKANLVSRSVVTGEGAERATVGLAPVELAYRMTEAQNATSKGHELLANAERMFNVDMGKDTITKSILEHMKPVQDSTREVFAKQQVLEHSVAELTKQERIFNKLLKKGDTVDKDGAAIKGLLDDVISKKETVLAEIRNGEPAVLEATGKINAAYEELAAKNVRTRISLAAEDTADYQRYPFLKGMMKENEKAYVEVYKDYMSHISERIEEAGGKAIKSEFFVHHSSQKTEAFEKGNEALRTMLEDFNIPNADVVLANSKFHSRTKFSYNFVPDIKYNSAEYIADAERRIAGMNFWKVGSDDGWDAVRKSSIALNSKKITGFFQALDDGMRPVESSFLNKSADNYSKLEVIRLLGGSVSAPFKHLLKLQADAATYGVATTLGTIPEALGVAGRNFIRNQVGKLVDAKFVSPEFGSKLWASSKEMDHVVQSMTSQKNMINYLSEIEQGMGSPYRNMASKFVDSISDAAGFGIKAIESFDRTLTVLAAAKMAQKNGMTAQQAIYGSYETMLLNNFMGGSLNSAWGRDPKVRAAMLFQNTPFKIWERRIVAAMNAGKDLKTTFGIIKSGKLEAEWQALQKIKGDMKEGEYKFKAGILFDSLTASRNAFGNSSSGILVKELMGIGAIMVGGKELFGVDMAPQFLHLPFVKTEGGTAELTTSPVLHAAMKTAVGKKPYGVDDTDWDEENKPFFMSTFYNHWKGSSGYSLFASKMGRINEGDIPEMYGSSVGKYLFALKNKE